MAGAREGYVAGGRSVWSRLEPAAEAAWRRTYAVLVHGSLLVSLVAAAKVAVVALVLSIPVTAAAGIGGLVTYAVYATNKLADEAEDAANDPARVAFVDRWRRPLAASAVVAYALALALAGLDGPLSVAITLAPGVAAAVYSGVLPGDWRVKDVLVCNTALVAVAWGAAVAYLPVVYADAAVGTGAHAMFWFFVARTAIAGELRNVRDVAGDAAAGVRTIPVVVGAGPTLALLLVVDVASVAGVAWAATVGAVPLSAPLALAPAVAFSTAITLLAGTDADLCDLCALRDGEYLLMLATVTIV